MSEITRGATARRRAPGPALARFGWSVWEWLARPLHYRAVRHLHVAAEMRDRDRLRMLLAPNVSVVVDSGRGGPSGIRVVQGFDDASVVLEHGFARTADVLVDPRSVNSQAGLIITRGGSPIASIAVDFTGRLISMIWVRLEPAGRRHWNTVYA